MNKLKWIIIKNIIAIICFTILAVIFNKWWIILFALLFITFIDFEGETK